MACGKGSDIPVKPPVDGLEFAVRLVTAPPAPWRLAADAPKPNRPAALS